MVMYCVKCKTKTESNNVIEVITKNNRKMLKSTCLVCGSKKSSFVSNKTGEGLGDILNNTIGKLGNLGVELHLPANKGEYVTNGSFNDQPKYSYCGPGTKYQQRTNEGYNGINKLDSMCIDATQRRDAKFVSEIMICLFVCLFFHGTAAH